MHFRRRKTTLEGVTKKGDSTVRWGNGRRTRRGRERARRDFATFVAERGTRLSNTETCKVFDLADDAGGV